MSYGGNSTPQHCSQMFVNKIKIVGTGINRTVTSLEPFYLLESDWTISDDQITGATNLIDHYGLKSPYQKYLRGNLKEELSGFLTHLSGNVNTPASNDESGLMHLIEHPPIQGKSFQTFNASQLDSAFRLHPGPLPQEFMSQFIGSPVPNLSAPNTSINGPSSVDASSTPASNSRKRRRDVHRSGLPNPVSSDYASVSLSHFPSVSSNPSSSMLRIQQQQVQHHHHHHPPSAAPTVNSSATAMGPHSGPLINPTVAGSLSSGNKPATSGGYFATPPPAVSLKRPGDDLSFSSSIASGVASSVESPTGYDFEDEIRRKKRRKEKKIASSVRRDRID